MGWGVGRDYVNAFHRGARGSMVFVGAAEGA